MIMPMSLQQVKDEIVMLNWLKDANDKYYKEQFNAGVNEEDIKELFKLRHFKELKPIIRAKLFISKELKKIMEQKQEEGRRRFAIRRIERNPIYQYGLGDKLRRKAYEAEF